MKINLSRKEILFGTDVSNTDIDDKYKIVEISSAESLEQCAR